ncbi:MAG: hypothetical protein ACYCVN_08210 [Acidimicrobiales bacterium]
MSSVGAVLAIAAVVFGVAAAVAATVAALRTRPAPTESGLLVSPQDLEAEMDHVRGRLEELQSVVLVSQSERERLLGECALHKQEKNELMMVLLDERREKEELEARCQALVLQVEKLQAKLRGEVRVKNFYVKRSGAREAQAV